MLASGTLPRCQLPGLRSSSSSASRLIPVQFAETRAAGREASQRCDPQPTRLSSSCRIRTHGRGQTTQTCSATSLSVQVREGRRLRRQAATPAALWCCTHSHPLQASSVESEGRHAILHDFCMIIPYSSIVFLAGIVSLFFGTGWKGVALAAAGAVELWLTLQSLKLWRVGAEHRLYTTITAGEDSSSLLSLSVC